MRIEVAVTIRPFDIFYDAAGRLKTTVKIKYLRTNNALPIGQARNQVLQRPLWISASASKKPTTFVLMARKL